MALESNIEAYRRAVGDMLDALSSWVDGSSKIAWLPSHGILPLVRSSLIKRQHECLEIAVDLADKGQGFAAVGFLRPACEEFLWAKYLASISKADAERLLKVLARTEIWDSLKAQDDHVGKAVMGHLGLGTYFRRMESSTKARAGEVKALGTKLRWEKRTVENSKLPSMAFIAKSVGETKLYKLLYHASSRYVHFSPHELIRRAWGKSGEITVSSAHFSDYWGSFVLYWGTYLLASTFSAASSLGDPSDPNAPIDEERLLAASAAIGELGPVPIITVGELEWE